LSQPPRLFGKNGKMGKINRKGVVGILGGMGMICNVDTYQWSLICYT